ncbi:helix-turn-helix transcriptional regulator [Kibdelosporangium persicum]|uniref:Transcriptional regulator n=2 Tax=Kibdelosporangium persicum TaxID=2698649 RepID=A0ABX2EZ25_9PSEU|nr:helix-turn-helix transcriptional regulator [Kibdelosporangium persicum]NRN64139.1 Transcriptional regulator [Kibdelosporangium persicum]
MRKRALGKELRKLREAANVRVETAAEELDCSVAKVRHIEGGRNVVKKTELSALVRLYRADDRLPVLEEIRREASKPGWWSTAKLPPYMQTYVGAESDARSMSVFTLELIPGLLQIEDYTRDLNRVFGITDVDNIIKVRTRRQHRLLDDDPLTLHAICSAAALQRLASAPYAEAQLAHLMAMSLQPNVTVQILPFDAGLHPAVMGGFVLLDFDPEISLPAVYFENVVAGDFVDDARIVSEVAASFATLRESAMSAAESIRYIKELM